MSTFRNSISRKLTVMNLLVSGGALLLASAAFFAYDLVTFKQSMAINGLIEAQIIGANAVTPLIFNDSQSAESTLAGLSAARHITYAGIYKPGGNFFAGFWPKGLPHDIPQISIQPENGDRFWFTRTRFHLVRLITFQDKLVGTVYMEGDLGAIYDRLRSYALILLLIFSVSLVAALALSRMSQRAISSPILKLAETAQHVSREKDYRARAAPTGEQDEVATLVNAFNEMLGEIQKRDSALQESERQFRTLADSIPQLAWMADPDGNLFWYNQRWYRYTGSTPEEMLGWGWESVHNPEVLPQVRKNWLTSIATGQPFEMIFPLRGADGAFRDFLTLAVPIRDEFGRVVRWFGTNTDITEQRRSQEALRQSEKLAATGRLAASIAHEINNPLEAVTNLVYLARRQPGNLEKYLKMADQELDRIAQITKNTLGFYRDSASPIEVDISEILEEVLALYGRKLDFKKITLHRDFAKGITVVAHPGEIRQIFANLTANAIDALSQGGQLTVRVSKVLHGNSLGRPGARITFLDNGTGIAPMHLKRIFEPFYTTKKDVGTGLGLWLTLGLVEKHQGILRVRSSVRPARTWTAFSIFLPERHYTN
jgi:PAS domain S-box-containing protein